MRLAGHRVARRAVVATLVSGVVAAGTLSLVIAANASPATAKHATRTVVPLQLRAMPAGRVLLFRDAGNNLDVQVTAFGFTPGSAHVVELVRGHRVITEFNTTLTANAVGQAAGIDLSSTFGGAVPPGSRVVILNGTAGDPVSAEPIAESSPAWPGLMTYNLHAVEAGLGSARGSAVLVYDPARQTISVTVNASGLTPGAHAAHIHVGSCQNQGGVQYMMMDFTANRLGQILHETRTVAGVTSPVPATGWYLNLHQGDSNTILANGQPTIAFRPLLCANI
ncbi:MAG TPA: CHRD domain-containing protein [Streptosporangiaceae bacterium]|nr:CHRD domain-containing protein [Streptosporangiaceae bacterium]